VYGITNHNKKCLAEKNFSVAVVRSFSEAFSVYQKVIESYQKS